MKYIRIIAVIVVLLVALTGCSSQQNASKTNAPVDAQSGEIPLLTIESYREWKSFMQETGAEQGILSYEALRSFGEFDHFVVLSGGYNGDYSDYMYFLKASGFGINIRICKRDKMKQIEYNSADTKSIGSDLRFAKENESGLFIQDEIQYKFRNGKLAWISWNTEKLNFTLSADTSLSAYFSEEETLLSKLLNKETAQGALQEFLKKLE